MKEGVASDPSGRSDLSGWSGGRIHLAPSRTTLYDLGAFWELVLTQAKDGPYEPSADDLVPLRRGGALQVISGRMGSGQKQRN